MTAGIRKLLCIAMVMVWVMPVTAKVSWGVRAGMSRSWMIQKVDLDYHSGSKMGYSVGALANIPFYRRFSFRPEIGLTNQGGSYESLMNADGLYTVKYSGNYYSLQVPLNVAFTIPISGVRMAVYAGPVPDFHIGGKMKVRGIGENPAPESKQEMKSFDLAMNSGICVEYKKILFSINILCGLLDRRIDKIDDESRVYQNNLTFSLGYIFK